MDKKIEPAGIHFLSFDQVHWIGESLGVTDLYYVYSVFHTRIIRVFNGSETSIDFEINHNAIHEQLREFLVDYFSQSHLFMGRPEYVRSEFFSEAEFEKILREAKDRIDRVREKALRQ